MRPKDGPERGKLARLRAERDALAVQVRRHPVMEQAPTEGCAKQTGYTLQKAAREDEGGTEQA